MSPLSQTPFPEQELEQLEQEAAKSTPAKAEVPDGLVPANELPSATEALAQLFPAEETTPRSDGTVVYHSAIQTEGDSSDKKAKESGGAQVASALATPEASARSDEPATMSFTPERAETEPRIAARETSRTLGEKAVAVETRSAEVEVQEARENVEKPEIAAPRAVDREAKARGHRARSAPFAWLVAGIRSLLPAKSSHKKEDMAHVETSSVLEGAEAISPTAGASSSEAIEVAAQTVGASENVAAPKVSPENPHELEVGIFEEVLKSEGSGATSGLAVRAENSASLDAPVCSEQVQESAPVPQANASPEQLPIEGFHPKVEARFEQPAHEAFSFDEYSAEQSPQTDKNESGDTSEEAIEAFDSSDDDHAIASAIERYANLTAAAPTDISAASSQEQVVQEQSRSDEQVDINEVLEIPRDPEPVKLLGLEPASVISSLPVSGPGDLIASESASFTATQEALTAGNGPANSPAPELPENASELNPAGVPYRDWSFEEKLAIHHEWLESKGARGKKADLNGIDFEGSDLIGVDLRFVDLHDANLRAADLLMADLRDACLVRTNFRDSCLVGANLEAANLEGASLETAMGLVPRQLAGANLREASLPPAILQFDALAEFRSTSRKVHGLFVAMMSMSALSALLILMTKDFQLLTNSAVLFFLHSPAAAAALPTVQFYLIAPCVLFILYLVFQFRLQHLWDLVLELPAVFQTGALSATTNLASSLGCFEYTFAG